MDNLNLDLVSKKIKNIGNYSDKNIFIDNYVKNIINKTSFSYNEQKYYRTNKSVKIIIKKI
jgi:hypothetical protein